MQDKIDLVKDPEIRELFKETLEVCETDYHRNILKGILDTHLLKYNN